MRSRLNRLTLLCQLQDNKLHCMFMFRVSKATCDIIEVFGFVSPPAPHPQALARFAVEVLQLYSRDATQKARLADAGYSLSFLCRSCGHAADQQGPRKTPSCQRQLQHFGLGQRWLVRSPH